MGDFFSLTATAFSTATQNWRTSFTVTRCWSLAYKSLNSDLNPPTRISATTLVSVGTGVGGVVVASSLLSTIRSRTLNGTLVYYLTMTSRKP